MQPDGSGDSEADLHLSNPTGLSDPIDALYAATEYVLPTGRYVAARSHYVGRWVRRAGPAPPGAEALGGAR